MLNVMQPMYDFMHEKYHKIQEERKMLELELNKVSQLFLSLSHCCRKKLFQNFLNSLSSGKSTYKTLRKSVQRLFYSQRSKILLILCRRI